MNVWLNTFWILAAMGLYAFGLTMTWEFSEKWWVRAVGIIFVTCFIGSGVIGAVLYNP